MPIDETVNSVVAPYRSHKDCRSESLHSRIDEVREGITSKTSHLIPDHVDLLLGIGYTCNEMKSKYNKNRKADMFTRKMEGYVDVLVEGEMKKNSESQLIYLVTGKENLRVLEWDISKCLNSGEALGRKIGLLMVGVIMVGFLYPLPLTSVVGWACLTCSVGDIGFELSSERRMKKLDCKYGHKALLAALYLPEPKQ